MNTFLSIISANIFISMLSLLGATLYYRHINKESQVRFMVSFAAGVMIATSLLNLIPEAIEGLDIELAMYCVIGGIIFSFILEKLLVWHHHHDGSHGLHPSTILVTVGDAIHNFLDGVALAAVFIVNPAAGLMTTLAIAAHEIPQELADVSILKKNGLSIRKALSINFLTACTAILGGIIGYVAFASFGGLAPYMIGFTAGVFLYVACADLIPELHNETRPSLKDSLMGIVMFSAGIVLMVCLLNTFSEEHQHNPGVNSDTLRRDRKTYRN